MKYFKPFLLLVFLTLSAGAQTNIIYVKAGNVFSGGGFANLVGINIVLTDTTQDPRSIDGIFIGPVGGVHKTDKTGMAYFTNVVWGTYNIRVSTSPESNFDIQVNTNTMGYVNAATLTSITNQPNPLSEFYTAAQIDAMFAGFNPGTGGQTNVSGDVSGFATNNVFSTAGLLKITNAAQTRVDIASNILQGEISAGGASLLQVTNVNNSDSGVIVTNGVSLTFKFSSTGTNAILGIAQPLINAASNTLAAASATLGANLINDVNTTSNSVLANSQAAINTASNTVNAGNLFGVVPLASIPASVVTNNGPNTITGDLTDIGTVTGTSTKTTSATANTLEKFDSGKNSVSVPNPSSAAGVYTMTNDMFGNIGWVLTVPWTGLSANQILVTDANTNPVSFLATSAILTNGWKGPLEIDGNQTNAASTSFGGTTTNFANAYFRGTINGNANGTTNTILTTLQFHVATNAFTNIVVGYLGPLTNVDGFVFWIPVGTNM